ncbi:MAG: type IV secretion system protein [Acidobacteria bacterium]|nr:type IV secretion system protein [Acidobacteriota bacterium]
MRQRIETLIVQLRLRAGWRAPLVVACVLAAWMFLLPTTAYAQETIGSKFMEDTMRKALVPVVMAFMTKVSNFVTPLLAGLATIFVIWTAIKNFLADRPFQETFAEILMTLLIVTALTNTDNYRWLFWDMMYGGLYTELVVPAGEGDTGFPAAVQELAHQQAERSAKWNLSTGMTIIQRIGESINTLETGGVAWLMQIGALFVEPLMTSATIFAIMSIAFFGAIGQIFLSMWLLDFTKDYTKKWFGCYMGAIFSLVAISFFAPFLSGWWSDVVAEAVQLENANKGITEKMLTPGLMKQFVWSFFGIMAALKAPSLGKELFR